MTVKAFLLALLFASSTQKHNVAAISHSYDVSHLLKPQLRFEINLIVPDSVFDLSPSLPMSMLESIAFLAANQVPFRLLYNKTKNLPPYITTRSSRYVHNKVSHLVFVGIHSKDQSVILREVLNSCRFGTDLVVRRTIDKSFFQLILDETVVGGSWKPWFRFNIEPYDVPLNFIIFHWSGTRFLFSDARLLRDTCECDDGSFTSPVV